MGGEEGINMEELEEGLQAFQTDNFTLYTT